MRLRAGLYILWRRYMNKHFLHKITRFGINWIVMTIWTYILIKLLFLLWVSYILASVVSYVVMVFVNYIISTKFVFKSKKSLKSLTHFLVSQSLSFLLFTLVNYILYTSWLDKNYCFLLAIIFSTTTNFLYNNFITFKK